MIYLADLLNMEAKQAKAARFQHFGEAGQHYSYYSYGTLKFKYTSWLPL